MPALQYFDVPIGGGMNTRDSSLHIQDNELSASSYWDYQRANSLFNRNIRRNLITTTFADPGPPTYITEVLVGTGVSPTRYLLIYCARLGRVLTSTDLATTSTLFTWTSTQGFMQADVLNGIVWMVNGGDAGQQWDGATVSTVTAMPSGAALIHMYKNVCFVASNAANPSRVWFSSLKDPTTWPTNNFQDVAPNDGDRIRALLGVTEGLLIFKNRSVWMMVGDTFDATNPQWRLVRIQTPVGVGSTWITPRYLPGVGVIWLANDGVYVWDGAHVEKVSLQIEQTFESLNPDAQGFDGSNSQETRLAQSTIFRNRYYLSIEETSASFSNRTLLIFTAGRKWSRVATTSAAFGIANYNNRLLFALYTNGGAPAKGVVQEQEIATLTGTSDVLSMASSDGYTKSFDFGASDQIKHFRRIFITYGMDSTYLTSPTLTITAYADGAITYPAVSIVLTPTSGYSLSTDSIGSETIRYSVNELNLQGRRLVLRYQTAGTPTDTRGSISLHQIKIEYSGVGIKGATL